MLVAALRRACAIALLCATPAVAQLPAGWKVLPDAPTADSLGAYSQMPPGWHLTARGPSAAVYDPAWTTGSRYVLEWDAFVFPNQRTEPFGLFFAGSGLDGVTPSYLAIQLTAEGELSVIHRAGAAIHLVVLPATNADFARPGVEEPARNVLRVSVETDSVRVTLNGKRAAAFAPTGDLAGTFGFRVGTGTNLHVARLDKTTPLAPPRTIRRSTN